MGEDIGATRFDWERQILAARLPAMTKLVALAAATYADPDGTRVHPGTARLAIICGIGYSTARKALADLRSAGLIDQVRRGSKRKATEYRLVLAADLVERLEWLSPAQIALEAERLNQVRAEETAKREARRRLRSPASAVGRAPDELRYGESVDNANCATGAPATALAGDHPPNQRPTTLLPNQLAADLRTDLAVTRARETEEEPPNFSEEDAQNRTGGTAPRRAERAIAEAQARMAARRAAHATGRQP